MVIPEGLHPDEAHHLIVDTWTPGIEAGQLLDAWQQREAHHQQRAEGIDSRTRATPASTSAPEWVQIEEPNPDPWPSAQDRVRRWPLAPACREAEGHGESPLSLAWRPGAYPPDDLNHRARRVWFAPASEKAARLRGEDRSCRLEEHSVFCFLVVGGAHEGLEGAKGVLPVTVDRFVVFGRCVLTDSEPGREGK